MLIKYIIYLSSTFVLTEFLKVQFNFVIKIITIITIIIIIIIIVVVVTEISITMIERFAS